MHLCRIGVYQRGRRANAATALKRWSIYVVMMVSILACTRSALSAVDVSDLTFQVAALAEIVEHT